MHQSQLWQLIYKILSGSEQVWGFMNMMVHTGMYITRQTVEYLITILAPL